MSKRRGRRKANMPNRSSTVDLRLAPRTGRQGYDGYKPELAFSDRIADMDKSAGTAPIENNNIDRITWLKAHKVIDDDQFNAARRLQKDWELAELMPHASLGEGGYRSGGVVLPNDAKVDAMKRHGDALDRIGGPLSMAGMLIQLVVEKSHSIERAAAMMHWHPKYATGVFVSALDILASYYGLRTDHRPTRGALRSLGEMALDKIASNVVVPRG